MSKRHCLIAIRTIQFLIERMRTRGNVNGAHFHLSDLIQIVRAVFAFLISQVPTPYLCSEGSGKESEVSRVCGFSLKIVIK